MRVCWWVWMVVRFVCVIRVPVCARVSRVCPGSPRGVFLPVSFYGTSQVKSRRKQQTFIQKPIECAPKASSGGREWAEMTEGFHLEVTRHRVLTYVPSEKK